jgi:hypothetical protein
VKAQEREVKRFVGLDGFAVRTYRPAGRSNKRCARALVTFRTEESAMICCKIGAIA